MSSLLIAANRTVLEGASATEGSVAQLTEGMPAAIGRFGTFVAVLATALDSSALAADTMQGLYVPSSFDTSLVWVREASDVWHTAWFGIIPGADVAAEWNAMTMLANILKPKNIIVDPGVYYADSALTKWNYIFGLEGSNTGKQPPVIVKRYVEADGDRGIVHCENFGGTIRGLNIRAVLGSTGGSLVTFMTTSTATNVGEIRIEKCTISGGLYSKYGINLNGETSTESPKGLRNIWISGCYIFNSANWGLLIKSCQSLHASNSTVAHVAGGDAMVITGSLSVHSDNILIDCAIGGDVTLSRLSFCHIEKVRGNVTNDGSVSNSTIGQCTGSIAPHWGSGCGELATGLHSRGVGWEKRIDGWLRQWGSGSTSGAGGASISFHKSFAGPPLIFNAQVTDDPGSGFKSAEMNNVTTTSASVTAFGFTTLPTAGPISANFSWSAEGY